MTTTIGTDLIENIFLSFLSPENPLTIKNLASVSVAVAQTVMREVIDTTAPRLKLVIHILQRLAGQNIALSSSDQVELANAIEYVIPHALVFMTQIEQGCIVLCEDMNTEATTCWTRCCTRKKKQTTPTAATLPTTTIPVSIPSTITLAPTTLTRTITDPLILKETSTTRLTILSAIAAKYHSIT